ncbi:MAG: hypothetical protein ACK567_05340 [Chitinophagales bacterium]|jgi:hypothetical protein
MTQVNTIDEREVQIASYKEDCLDKVKDILWVVFRIQDIDADKTYNYIAEGLKICDKLDFPSQKYKLLAYQAAMFEKEYCLEDALMNYTQSAEYFKKTKDEWMYSNMLDSIAGIYSKTNRKQEAFNLYTQVIKICKKLNKSDELFLGLLNNISLSLELKRFKLAKNYHNHLQTIQSRLTFMAESSPIYIFYYQAKFELLAKNYTEAIQTIDNAIKISESKAEYQYEKAMCLALKVNILYNEKRYILIPIEIQKIREITQVSVTTYLKDALDFLYKYYEKTKDYQKANETLKELFAIREQEFISKKLTSQSDKFVQAENATLVPQYILIQDYSHITKRIEINDIVSIQYDNRFLSIHLSDGEILRKQIALTEFLNLLHAQVLNRIIKINRTQAVNLFYMDSYNSTNKELTIEVFGQSQTFQVTQRQEKNLKSYRL